MQRVNRIAAALAYYVLIQLVFILLASMDLLYEYELKVGHFLAGLLVLSVPWLWKPLKEPIPKSSHSLLGIVTGLVVIALAIQLVSLALGLSADQDVPPGVLFASISMFAGLAAFIDARKRYEYATKDHSE